MSKQKSIVFYDRWLIAAVLGLLLLGLMMVASSSVMVATKIYQQPFHFLLRQAIYLAIGLMVAMLLMRVDTHYIEKISAPLLIFCLILLVLVLIPGIGHKINGSRRWLVLGPLSMQVSEIVKLGMIIYLAGYMVRQQHRLKENIFGFLAPLAILGIVACLLLSEPDFGATVVIVTTVLAMLFLTDIKLRYFVGLVALVIVIMAFIAISSPYRMLRLTAFLNPWADQYKSGYQLTQSLIAFGRGGFYGVGLGDGIQKLFYLPEASTDFLFAVLAEELGMIGILLVLLLYSIMLFRGFKIGFNAYNLNRLFAAFTAYGLTFWLGLQAMINMGVNIGLLPTKGLTLPFLSYGGASLITNCLAIALLLRIDYENRWQTLGL